MARRPVQLAFGQPYLAPGGDVQMMRRTPYSSVTAGGVTRTTPAGTAVESVGATPTFSQMQAMRAARQPMLPPAPAGGPQLPPPPPARRGLSFTPQSRGMLAGALAGLQYAGPQAQPTSFAQGLGVMGQAAMEAFTKAEEAKRARELEDRTYRLKLAELGAPNLTTLEKNLRAAGFRPDTPEYQEAVRAYLAKSTAPSVTVDMGAGSDVFKKASIEYSFKRLGNEDKAIASVSVLENELDTVKNLIEGGAETGRIAKALIPIQQLLAEAGLVGDEEMDKLADRELLQRSISRIIPNMRVEGSGSTSDYEMATFEKAAPSFSRTPEGNRKIAAGMLQGIRYVRERRSLMDDYMKDKELGDGSLIGFDRWADEKQGKVFKVFDAEDPNALDAYKKAYQDGQIKVGDLIFNGKTYIFVTEESVEGF